MRISMERFLDTGLVSPAESSAMDSDIAGFDAPPHTDSLDYSFRPESANLEDIVTRPQAMGRVTI